MSRNFPWFYFDVVSHAFTIWIAFSTFVQTDAISCYFFPFFRALDSTRIPGSVSVLPVDALHFFYLSSALSRIRIRALNRLINIIIAVVSIRIRFDWKEKNRVGEEKNTRSYECMRIAARVWDDDGFPYKRCWKAGVLLCVLEIVQFVKSVTGFQVKQLSWRSVANEPIVGRYSWKREGKEAIAVVLWARRLESRHPVITFPRSGCLFHDKSRNTVRSTRWKSL